MPLLGSFIKRSIALRGLVVPEPNNRPIYYQRRVLKKLLIKAQFTHFGQHYNFGGILNSRHYIKTYQQTIPIHDYNTIFSQWWNKCLHYEENVCWPGQVKYFALSSGTSDSSSKHIPVTLDLIKSIKKTSYRQFYSLGNYDLPKELFQKGILMLGGSTQLQNRGSYYEGDLSGITTGRLPFWFQHFYKPGRRISRQQDWGTKLDEITEMAPNWDIGVIVGVPAWLQMLLEKIIARYNLKTIHDIWPNLSIYVHGGVSFEPYKKSFQALLGKPLKYMETYLASEGFVALQEYPDRGMNLVLNNGLFYEFIPFNDNNFTADGDLKGKPNTLLIDEVKEDEEYALLISSNAGAWRYLIGDVIKFTNKQTCEIAIVGRTKHYLSLCGEHLSVDNMTKAIQMVSNELNISIPEFTVAGIPYGTLFAHKWYVGCDNVVNAEVLKNKIDEKLKMLNDDYRIERTSALKEIILEVLPTNVFLNWMEHHGKMGSQNKFPRVMKKQLHESWSEFVQQQMAH
ncbi:MAG: GH3 auxin-responsive promoter family protein [Bacteroidia bacterium]